MIAASGLSGVGISRVARSVISARQEDDEEQRLVARLLELVRAASAVWLSVHGGAAAARRLAGESQAGLSAVAAGGPQSAEKQRKSGVWAQRAGSCVRRRAEHKDHVWAWDFVFDRTANGRPLKWLSIVDEYTRECLALEVDRGMTSERRARRARRPVR